MCTTPLQLSDRIVSCGHCIECLTKRSQEWAFRLEQESKDATSGIFLTLTYDDNNAIWIDNEEGETLTTLSKRDWQLFMKRLRKAQGPLKNKQDYREKLRYFMCGEYGPSTGRAHYHAIIYNLKKNVVQDLPKYWRKGHIKVDDVTPKSIRYVTNYMLLKDQNCSENQLKPFTLMSKKPILGARYIVRNFYHHHTNQDHKLVHARKNRRNLYKIYERKLFTEEERKILQEKREADFLEYKTTYDAKLEQLDPLDPIGRDKQEKKHRAYIKQKRQKKREL